MKKSSIKTGNRILSFLLVMFILLLFFTPNSYVSAEEIVATQETLREIRMNATADLNNQLQSTIAVNHEYPDDYAGAYKDEEGNLIIGVTNEEAISKYQEILSSQIITEALDQSRNLVRSSDYHIGINAPISSNELVQYEVMPYSYNEIFAVHMLLGHAMAELGISRTAIVDNENTLYVNLTGTKTEQEVLNYVKENGLETEFISFTHNSCFYNEDSGEDFVQQNQSSEATRASTETIYAGTRVWGEEDGTIGFAALYNGKAGYVTAGHVARSTKTMQYIGEYMHYGAYPTVVVNAGYGDFAFVPNSGCLVKSTVYTGSKYIDLTGTTSLAVGASIKFYGNASQAEKSGRVLASSVNHYSDVSEKYYFDLLGITQGLIFQGDSGGPAYSGSKLTGIVHGDDGDMGYICKYSNIQSYGVAFVPAN